MVLAVEHYAFVLLSHRTNISIGADVKNSLGPPMMNFSTKTHTQQTSEAAEQTWLDTTSQSPSLASNKNSTSLLIVSSCKGTSNIRTIAVPIPYSEKTVNRLLEKEKTQETIAPPEFPVQRRRISSEDGHQMPEIQQEHHLHAKCLQNPTFCYTTPLVHNYPSLKNKI